MSIGGFIQDGTGRGYLAKVDSNNRLEAKVVSESEFIDQTEKGESFNLNTLYQLISVGTETPLLYVLNNESNPLSLINWFFGLGIQGAAPTETPLLRVYANPTAVSGGVAILPQNRRFGSPRTFGVVSLRQDAGTPLLATPPSTPVLFQSGQTNNRSFGEVNLVLPQGQSLLVTVQANGAQPINVYTGFSGYVLPSLDT